MGGQRQVLAALIPGNDPVPTLQEADGPHGRPGQVRKISPPTEIRSPDRSARSESLYRLSYRVIMNEISHKTSLLIRLTTRAHIHTEQGSCHSLCQMAHHLLQSVTDGNFARWTLLRIYCSEHSLYCYLIRQ